MEQPMKPSLVILPARGNIRSGDTYTYTIRYNPDSGPDRVETIDIDFGDGTPPETHPTVPGTDEIRISHRYEYIRPPRGKYTGKTYFPRVTGTGARGTTQTLDRAVSVTVASE